MIPEEYEAPCTERCEVEHCFDGGESIISRARCTGTCCYHLGHGDGHTCLQHDKLYYGGAVAKGVPA